MLVYQLSEKSFSHYTRAFQLCQYKISTLSSTFRLKTVQVLIPTQTLVFSNLNISQNERYWQAMVYARFQQGFTAEENCEISENCEVMFYILEIQPIGPNYSCTFTVFLKRSLFIVQACILLMIIVLHAARLLIVVSDSVVYSEIILHCRFIKF